MYESKSFKKEQDKRIEDRRLSMLWWNNQTNVQKVLHTCTYISRKRASTSLTGREIQMIWEKENGYK